MVEAVPVKLATSGGELLSCTSAAQTDAWQVLAGAASQQRIAAGVSGGEHACKTLPQPSTRRYQGDGDCDGTKAADHATDVCVAASGSGGGDVSRAAARFVSPATRIVSPARDMAPVLRARALFTPRRVSLSVQVVSPT